MRTAKTRAVYDGEHRYAIDHRRDPAYPGVSPEPVRAATVAGVRKVPAAYSWVACAQPVHHDLVAELLAAQHERRLLRIVGWGDQSDAWMACSDGPDGVAAWLVPYDTGAAADDLAAAQAARARPRRTAARRFALLAAGLATLAVTVWLTVAGLDAHHASDHLRALVGLAAAAVLVLALGAAAVLARRHHSSTTTTGTTHSRR